MSLWEAFHIQNISSVIAYVPRDTVTLKCTKVLSGLSMAWLNAEYCYTLMSITSMMPTIPLAQEWFPHSASGPSLELASTGLCP